MLRRRTFVAVLVLLAAGPDRAGAAPGGVLDLVTGTDFAPFVGEDLPEGGMLTELVLRAFKAVGMSYEVRFVPWKRGYDGVVAGRFLGTFPYVRTHDREREVLYSDPLLEVRQLVYLSTKSGMQFRTPADFRGRSVCAPVGYALPAELQALLDGGVLTRESPSDLFACVRMVASGRCDAFVLDEYTGHAAVARAGMEDGIRIAEQPYALVAQHLVVSKANPEAQAVLAAFNAGLRKLKENGTFADIVRRHAPAAR